MPVLGTRSPTPGGDPLPRAILLSEPGSGGTTFVGLFYLAQTRLATERADSFRFSAPPESIRHLSSLYEHLVVGEFPASLAPAEVAQIRFDLAFDSPGRRGLFHRTSGFEPRVGLECRWNRARFEVMARVLEGGAVDPTVSQDLGSYTIPIFLLDPRTEPASPDPTGTAPPSRDLSIARTLQEL